MRSRRIDVPFWLMIVAIAIIMVSLDDAEASGYRPTASASAKSNQTVKVNVAPKLEQTQGQTQAQTTATDVNATGGSNGDQVSMNSSQFYALSLMFPNASGCFTGVQGGAQNSDMGDATSGFLGLHLLNTSCWMDKLASQEQDIMINTLLKCGDKKYRNALAWNVPRKEKHQKCIDIKYASGLALMEDHKKKMQKIIDEARAETKRLTELRETDRIDCDESKNRIVDACRK